MGPTPTLDAAPNTTTASTPVGAEHSGGVESATDDQGNRTKVGRARPAGVAPGGLAFFGAWAVGLAVARLTGAAAVVLLLVVGAVALVAATTSGWLRLRGLRAISLSAPPSATSGETFTVVIDHTDTTTSRAPLTLWLTVNDGAASTIEALDAASNTSELAIERAGTVTSLSGYVASTGTAGLLWWRRPITIDIDPIRVAPQSVGPTLCVDESPSLDDGESTGGPGRPIGDVDGIRPWRQGEGDQAIHWPSTVRSGQIVAHARTASVETQWMIPLDSEPDRLRWTLEQGVRHGHEVFVEFDDGETAQVKTLDDAARWATIAADRRGKRFDEGATTPWWRRQLSMSRHVTEPVSVNPSARWFTAIAAALALNMLLGALDAASTTRVLATLGLAVGAALSVRFRDGTAPMWVRVAVAALAVAALARIAVQASGIGGLIEALRGPMPDLLMVLLVLHGAESANRRTVRVHLAITSVIIAYAAGLRIDDRVGWWMLAWGVAAIAALGALTASHDASSPTARNPGRWFRVASWVAASSMLTFALASFVPIPDGPASLGLPAVSNDDAVIDSPGSLVGPDGNTAPPETNTPSEAPNRGALGEVGGYPGFSETLDTSVRGDLGDEIVMRVRAPEPAFWRGQTFTQFDGRTWRITGDDGPNVDGPQIDVEPTLGDLAAPGVPIEEFVQTYHVEADLPNVIFAASRPETIVFDGSVNTRPDGALRADRALTDGTIYTVVSQRVQVTPEMLRAQGDLAERFAAIDDPRADELLAPYLALPESTTERTLDLAQRLRVDGSTYDTVHAYQNWLSTNTEYDLNAPVPEPGADAVDDYLFVSRRGFCEQIASSLVVMLRSQGVPARLATGYIPGERDQVSGVWKVRASDAHAWVEVWFPDTGWEAFDPTAVVPLAGDTESSTVGNDVASAVIGGITSRPVEVALVALLVSAAFGAIRGVRELRRRRQRGAWGLLHDRFAALAPDALTVHHVADTLAAHDMRAEAHRIAELLDRVAFDPTFTPSDNDLAEARRRVAELERARRKSGGRESRSLAATSSSN